MLYVNNVEVVQTACHLYLSFVCKLTAFIVTMHITTNFIKIDLQEHKY